MCQAVSPLPSVADRKKKEKITMNLKKVVLCVLLAQAPRQNAEKVRAI
jgi:hypothetical protein